MAGRPPKYKTPEEMQRVIDLYFTACRVNQGKENGALESFHLSDEDAEAVKRIDDVFPTVTGLALALDMTREGLVHYDGKPEFTDTIKKAKSRVEAFVEQRLYHANATGSIFNLKNNFGWKDAQEKKISGTLGLQNILDDLDGTGSGLPSDQE